MKKGKKTWIKPRHRIVRAVLCYPVKLFFFLFYGLRTERYKNKGSGKQPCLILGNHTTPLDSVCLGTSFQFPIYYVASDHVLRQGWISRLLEYLVAPIPIVKSKFDLRTVKDMMTIVKEGGSVSLFPEGNRNYNGETARFSPAVARLAKSLGITMILYRFSGGYLTAPRWADSVRRGRMIGRVVHVVTAEELKSMSVDEIFNLIKSQLYENAFDNQMASPAMYPGKRLAEALERVLYLCPSCGEMGTLHSKDDAVICRCGLKARYTEYGFFKPAGEARMPFATVLEWDKWQKEVLPQWLESHSSARDGIEPLISDGGQKLYACNRAGENSLIGEGCFQMHADRFSFEGGDSPLNFPLEAIEKVIIHGKQTLQFTSDGITYEVRSPHPRSALKYMNLFELLRSSNREVSYGFFSL